MEKINAIITGVGGYVPDYVLTNDEISKMVDTTDEWIMGRIGIKERRILKDEGLGTSYIARKAAKQLIQRTRTNPDDIDLVIVATTTPDYRFPSTASLLCEKLGLKRAFAFDMQAVCSGFLYALETGANFIRSGNYKKIIVEHWWMPFRRITGIFSIQMMTRLFPGYLLSWVILLWEFGSGVRISRWCNRFLLPRISKKDRWEPTLPDG